MTTAADQAPGRSTVTGTATSVDLGDLHELRGRWVYAGELGYDFRGLTPAQTRRIAPFVVEAAWRRDQGCLLLIHGGRAPIEPVLRQQWIRGDWMAWAYWHGSKRHRAATAYLLLGLRAAPRDWPRPGWPQTPLPDLQPGCEDFDEPRCVGETKRGTPCRAPAAPRRPYCTPHDPTLEATR
ncbi:MAG: hypothetical protein ACR2LK_14135 [Solirubrobacteraceae bacterium]